MNFKINIAIVSLIAITGYAHVHSHKCSHDHTVGRDVPNAPDSHPPVGRVVPNAPRRLEDKPPYQHTHSQLPDLSASLPLCSSALKPDSHTHSHTPHSQLSTLNSPLSTLNSPLSTLNSQLTLPSSVQRSLGLKTVRAQMRRITSTMSFAGRYELNPDARKIVSSPVAGRLTLLVRPLADVKKGDALFTVSSPDLVARSREIAALEKRLAVYREIKTPNAALENELAVKRAERESMLAGAEEKDGTVTVRAASDGMVEALPAKDGSWLEIGSTAVQTVRTRDLRFKALTAASDVVRLKDGMPAKVGENPGRIKIGVGDDSGIVPVYVLFDNEPSAFAGERGRAECVTDETESPQMAVPSKAIVQIGAQPVVFTRDAHNPELFSATPVVPGLSGNGWTAISLPSSCPHDHTVGSCVPRDRGGAGRAALPTPHSPLSTPNSQLSTLNSQLSTLNSQLSTLNSPLLPEVVTDGAYELKIALPTGGAAKPAGHFHADGTFHEGEH